MSGRGTTDAIVLVRQFEGKYVTNNKKPIFLHGLSVIKSMYENVRNYVRVNGTFSEESEVEVGVHLYVRDLFLIL